MWLVIPAQSPVLDRRKSNPGRVLVFSFLSLFQEQDHSFFRIQLDKQLVLFTIWIYSSKEQRTLFCPRQYLNLSDAAVSSAVTLMVNH